MNRPTPLTSSTRSLASTTLDVPGSAAVPADPVPPGTQPRTRKPVPARRGGDGLGWLRLICAVALVLLVGLPLAALVLTGADARALQVFADPAVVQATANSLVSAGASAVLATAIGAALALVLERGNLPGASVLRWLVLLPFLIPPFIGAMAWMALLGANGPVNRLLLDLGLGPVQIFGGPGVIWLLTVHSYPMAYLVIAAALRGIPGNLEEAARISGAGTWRVLGRVNLPLLRPALLAAFVLSLVANLSDFGIPALIGLPERYTTLTTLVYRYLASSTTTNPLPAVSAIGMLLLVLALCAVLAQRRLPGTDTQLAAGARAARMDFGALRHLLASLVWTWILVVCLVPLAALAGQALLPAPGVALNWENLTLQNFTVALSSPGTLGGIRNSVLLAGGAAVACAVLGLLIALLLTRTSHRTNAALDVAATLPQALPGLVIAVGWLLIAPALGIFNTPWVILGAYVMAFIALVVQAVRAPLAAVSASLEDAAQSAGASRARALLDVSARLGLPAAATGAVVVFLTAVRELTISILLVAPGSQTLGVTIFNLQQAGDLNSASALALMVAVLGIVGLSLTALISNRRGT